MIYSVRHTFTRLAAAVALMICGGAAQAGARESIPSGSTYLSGSPLEVVVTNVRAARGHVHVDVCPKETFLTDEDCIYVGSAPATAGTTTVIVPRLPPGRYAVQAYLDENDNGKVDRNALGIPKESVGFSRDPSLLLGPPRFKTVAIEQTPSGASVHVKLKSFP